jgi:hypothetical protein
MMIHDQLILDSCFLGDGNLSFCSLATLCLWYIQLSPFFNSRVKSYTCCKHGVICAHSNLCLPAPLSFHLLKEHPDIVVQLVDLIGITSIMEVSSYGTILHIVW